VVSTHIAEPTRSALNVTPAAGESVFLPTPCPSELIVNVPRARSPSPKQALFTHQAESNTTELVPASPAPGEKPTVAIREPVKTPRQKLDALAPSPEDVSPQRQLQRQRDDATPASTSRKSLGLSVSHIVGESLNDEYDGPSPIATGGHHQYVDQQASSSFSVASFDSGDAIEHHDADMPPRATEILYSSSMTSFSAVEAPRVQSPLHLDSIDVDSPDAPKTVSVAGAVPLARRATLGGVKTSEISASDARNAQRRRASLGGAFSRVEVVEEEEEEGIAEVTRDVKAPVIVSASQQGQPLLTHTPSTQPLTAAPFTSLLSGRFARIQASVESVATVETEIVEDRGKPITTAAESTTVQELQPTTLLDAGRFQRFQSLPIRPSLHAGAAMQDPETTTREETPVVIRQAQQPQQEQPQRSRPMMMRPEATDEVLFFCFLHHLQSAYSPYAQFSWKP